MASIEALILAAGRGSRLGGSAHEMPKCLLEVGRRRLIEHQLDALAEAGVGPVHLVVGYSADEIREIVGMRADYVVNTRWQQTNSIYSFWLARQVVGGDIMVLNSDVLFAPEIIGRLVDEPGDAVAVDSGSVLGREQMKIKAIDGRLVEMSKDLPKDQATSENVGILKLTAETAAVAFERAGRLIENGGEKNWVGAAMTDIAGQRDIRLVDVAGLPWIEIDFPVDLARARRDIWPAITGGAYRRRRLWRAAAWLAGSGLLVGALAIGPMLPRPWTQPPSEWENVAIDNLEPVRISLGDHSQDWWILEEGAVAEVGVSAGGPVRVDSRLLDPASEQEPYVLEILLDDERVDWFKLTTRTSGMATHPDWIVGHKKRLKLSIPDHGSRLKIRLVAPQNATCLVRVRQLLAESEE